jgi:lipopolysaccharide transport system ATP-binding protein
VQVGGEAGRVEEGVPLTMRVRLRREGTAVRSPIVGVSVHRVEGDVTCCEASTDADDVVLEDLQGELLVTFRWDDPELCAGEYVVDVGVYEAGWAFAYDYHWHVHRLTVTGENRSQAIFRPRSRSWTVERP